MQTLQQRTQRMMFRHLTARPSGRIITLAGIGATGSGRRLARAQDATPSPFAAPVDVINYALTLEHIEATFYRLGLETFATADFQALGYQPTVRDRIVTI